MPYNYPTTGTNGAALDTNYYGVAYKLGAGSGSAEYQSNELDLQTDPTDWDAMRLVLRDGAGSPLLIENVEIYMVVRSTNTPTANGNGIYVNLRQQSASSWAGTEWYNFAIAANGYYFNMARNGFGSIDEYPAGAASSEVSIGDQTTGSRFALRMQATGTTIQFKLWDPAGSEPGSWTSVTDATHTGASAISFGLGCQDGTSLWTLRIETLTVTNLDNTGAGFDEGPTPGIEVIRTIAGVTH